MYGVYTDIKQCPHRAGRKFYKHLCAVYNSGIHLLHTPELSYQDLVELATLALGNIVDYTFFKNMDTNINVET